MKLKTYFGQKLTRVIAVLLLLIALAAAILTVYDAMHAVPKQTAGTNAEAPPHERKPRVSREEATENVADATGECREKNPSWFTCRTDKECVDVLGPCGGRDAVNRQFRSLAEDCHRMTGASMRCDPFDRHAARARCVEGICIAQKQEQSAPKTP